MDALRGRERKPRAATPRQEGQDAGGGFSLAPPKGGLGGQTQSNSSEKSSFSPVVVAK